jgi:hypothetical protein
MSAFAVFFDFLALGLILVRQWRARPVPLRLHLGVPIFLGIIGIFQLSHYASGHPLGSATALWVTLWLAIGAGMGALRGLTAQVWRADGPFRWVVRRGTWATMALWGLSVALHLILVGRAAGASFLLSLGIGYGVQRAVEQAKAAKIRALEPVEVGPGLFGFIRGFSREGGWSFGFGGPEGSTGYGFFGAADGPPASSSGGIIEADSEIVPPHHDELEQ